MNWQPVTATQPPIGVRVIIRLRSGGVKVATRTATGWLVNGSRPVQRLTLAAAEAWVDWPEG